MADEKTMPLHGYGAAYGSEPFDTPQAAEARKVAEAKTALVAAEEAAKSAETAPQEAH